MFEDSVIRPAWSEFDPGADLRCANAEDRVNFGGPGSELLRCMYVERGRAHMAAFWEHGSLADLAALCAAFDLINHDWRRRDDGEFCRATLLEALLAVLGFQARDLLNSGLQRPPM